MGKRLDLVEVAARAARRARYLDDVLHHGSIVAGNPAMHRWLIDFIGSA
ncbi:MAG: hypothetical protein ACREMR_02900 [Gemmatimonadales bacterium]